MILHLQFLNAVIDVPVVHVVQVHFPVAAQRLFPFVQTVRRTIDVPQLLNTVAHVPVVQVELDYWYRREGDSRDLTAAAVEKSLAPGGSGSSPWWSWFDGWIFHGPAHRYRAGGRVHRDTALHN